MLNKLWGCFFFRESIFKSENSCINIAYQFFFKFNTAFNQLASIAFFIQMLKIAAKSEKNGWSENKKIKLKLKRNKGFSFTHTHTHLPVRILSFHTYMHLKCLAYLTTMKEQQQVQRCFSKCILYIIWNIPNTIHLKYLTYSNSNKNTCIKEEEKTDSQGHKLRMNKNT